MTYVTPVVSASEKNKKEISGPRVETLMLIRQFAHTYEYQPDQKERKSLLN